MKPPPFPIYGKPTHPGMRVSARRARIMCNAWYGLSLYSGLERTATEKEATVRTIRYLRNKGMLYADTVTDIGCEFLLQLLPPSRQEQITVQSAPDQTMSTDHARPV